MKVKGKIAITLFCTLLTMSSYDEIHDTGNTIKDSVKLANHYNENHIK